MENRAAAIHDGLKHPIIDGDGHWMEPIPVFLEYLREVGGAKSVDQMNGVWRVRDAWYRATPQERRHSPVTLTVTLACGVLLGLLAWRPGWFFVPSEPRLPGQHAAEPDAARRRRKRAQRGSPPGPQ